MAKFKDLKVNLEIDTRDWQIELLKMQNELLERKLEMQKIFNDQDKPQRTAKLVQNEFLDQVTTAFESTYGYPIDSTKLSVRTECGTDINTRKTYNIEINTVGVI